MLGVSPQDLDSHEKWAEKKQLPFVLLADPEKKVITMYGAKGIGLIPVKRTVFVIDPDGVVQYASGKLLGVKFSHADKMIPILEGL